LIADWRGSSKDNHCPSPRTSPFSTWFVSG